MKRNMQQFSKQLDYTLLILFVIQKQRPIGDERTFKKRRNTYTSKKNNKLNIFTDAFVIYMYILLLTKLKPETRLSSAYY